MQILKVFGYLFLLIAISYGSLWYGFFKGYEYNNSHRLSDAVVKTAELHALRNGKEDKAINLLEQGLDTNIIEYFYSDKDFIKYIIGLPRQREEIDRKLINKIKTYREASSYICTSDKQLCDLINEILNIKHE